MCVLCDWWGGGLWECGLCGQRTDSWRHVLASTNQEESTVEKLMLVIQNNVSRFHKTTSRCPLTKIVNRGNVLLSQRKHPKTQLKLTQPLPPFSWDCQAGRPSCQVSREPTGCSLSPPPGHYRAWQPAEKVSEREGQRHKSVTLLKTIQFDFVYNELTIASKMSTMWCRHALSNWHNMGRRVKPNVGFNFGWHICEIYHWNVSNSCYNLNFKWLLAMCEKIMTYYTHFIQVHSFNWQIKWFK